MTATTPFLKGSPAPRYWNMARQRYCRRLARYRNTRSVTADPGTKPAAHTRAESRGFGPSKVDAAERQTLRWRKTDSNPRSPRIRYNGFETATFERFITFLRCGKAIRNLNPRPRLRE